MRALFLLPSFGGGGLERATVNLLPALESGGLESQITALEGVETVYSKHPEILKRYVPLNTGFARSGIRLAFRFATMLRRIKPDVVISIGPGPNIVAALAIILTPWRIRHVAWEQNQIRTGWLERMPLARRLPRSVLLGLAYQRACLVIASCEGLKQALVSDFRLPDEKVAVVYNTVDIDAILLLSKTSESRSRTTNNKLRVLAAGRLVEQKDYPTLLAAVARCQHRELLEVAIAGTGPLEYELKNQVKSLGISEQVSFLGYRKDIWNLMLQAHVFVLSSRWEGFANVLAEALACGCRVISTCCASGPAEILENGKWGKLVPVGNVDALAAAIDEHFDPQDQWRPVDGQVARAADFSIPSQAERLLSRLRSIEGAQCES